MPLDVQGKFLQVLESSRIRPVGGGEAPAISPRWSTRCSEEGPETSESL
jgi:transcriptional regulator with AAA-type ATPase domain